jgi:Flp pilus assembly protein TadD
MSKSRYFQAGASVLASFAFAACATTSSTSPASVAPEASEFAKPTAEDIALISRAEPLAQVNYWNQQYNLHPVDLDIAMAFIRSLRQIGSFERAAEVANLAVVSHPQSAELYIELGRANASQRKSREALRAYSRALDINPNDPYPFAAVGIILDREGQHTSAQKAYAEALSRSPNRPTTLSNYGLSLALSGNLPDAEDKLRKATSLPEATPAIRQNFALVLGLQGKFDEARDIAAQDAPNGIAERNTDFLAQMIGTNTQLQAISDIAAAQDAPKAAPSQAVQTVALAEPVRTETRPAPTAQQPSPQPTNSPRRRTRRNTLVTGGLD